MAAVSELKTYTDLKTAIANLLDRTDLAVEIPLWIQLMEKSPGMRKLRHYKMEIKEFGAGSQDDPVVRLPTGWLEARNIEVDGRQVTYQSPDVVDRLRDIAALPGNIPSPVDADYVPQHFTYRDSHLLIYPTPPEDFTVTLEYYQEIPPLADAVNGINWLITEAPGAYLYGAAIHSAPHLRDDPRIATWEKLFITELLVLQDTSTDAMQSGSRITRTAQVRLG